MIVELAYGFKWSKKELGELTSKGLVFWHGGLVKAALSEV